MVLVMWCLCTQISHEWATNIHQDTSEGTCVQNFDLALEIVPSNGDVKAIRKVQVGDKQTY